MTGDQAAVVAALTRILAHAKGHGEVYDGAVADLALVESALADADRAYLETASVTVTEPETDDDENVQ